MRDFQILLTALLLSSGGCQYFDFQYQPPGFSSTQHQYAVEEKVRQWHAQQERETRLAELQQRLAGSAVANEAPAPTVTVENEIDSTAARE